jgi:hypothetical protein
MPKTNLAGKKKTCLVGAKNLAGTMKAETPWVEESREFFGLIILIAVLASNYFYGKKKANATN